MWGGVASFLLDLRWRDLGSRERSGMLVVRMGRNMIYYYRLLGGVDFLRSLMLADLYGVIDV